MNKGILFKNRDEWRVWLESNHLIEKQIWLIYYKKHIMKNSIAQPDAVEEALCYGWIDSIVKRIDEEKYMQKFTPRNEKSRWSDINKKRVALLITNGKMTKHGLRKINIAKKNGMWNKVSDITNLNFMPEELEKEFLLNSVLKNNWDDLAPSHKKQYLYWINSAKKDETCKKRIKKAIILLNNNEKLGMV